MITHHRFQVRLAVVLGLIVGFLFGFAVGDSTTCRTWTTTYSDGKSTVTRSCRGG